MESINSEDLKQAGEAIEPVSRRSALCRLGAGFGLVALSNMVQSSLAQAEATGSGTAGILKELHFKPRAKRVVFLFMNGGVSHVDTWDPKPMLEKHHGEPVPQGMAPFQNTRPGTLMKSPFKFQKYGQSGMDFSELWPKLGECADDLCMIRSMVSDIPNHEPCLSMMNTGSNVLATRPSMGSWLSYGLGTENANLPSYIVLLPGLPISGGPPLWGNAFLPAVHQGTLIKNEWDDGKPYDYKKLIPNINNDAVVKGIQKRDVGLLRALNDFHRERLSPADSQLDASIKTMERAYQMQTEAPEVFDISREKPEVREMYGTGSVSLGCLLAARLAEKGVRMVQVWTRKGDPWDAHDDIMSYVRLAKEADQCNSALIKDLKQRGLFEDTLIVGGTEMGRTPNVELRGGNSAVINGRDHNHQGFSIWLAGGGVKGGMTYGATDDLGFKAVDKPVHVHDLHATILYLMGIDHTKLTYRFSGRDFRLTDTAGQVIHDIIA
jgi:Protein of unknown function (DUF1501)